MVCKRIKKRPGTKFIFIITENRTYISIQFHNCNNVMSLDMGIIIDMVGLGPKVKGNKHFLFTTLARY